MPLYPSAVAYPSATLATYPSSGPPPDAALPRAGFVKDRAVPGAITFISGKVTFGPSVI